MLISPRWGNNMIFSEFLDQLGLELVERTRNSKLLEEDFKIKLENMGLEMRAAAYHIKRKEQK